MRRLSLKTSPMPALRLREQSPKPAWLSSPHRDARWSTRCDRLDARKSESHRSRHADFFPYRIAGPEDVVGLSVSRPEGQHPQPAYHDLSRRIFSGDQHRNCGVVIVERLLLSRKLRHGNGVALYFKHRSNGLQRHQFGGTFGGPIVQNRLFFFGGYQGTTIRQDPSDIQGFVPTPAMLAGDFTAYASAACNSGRAITLRTPFVNNRVDPSQFSKAALAIAAKLPSSSDPCGKVIYGNPSRPNQHMAVGKIDYQRAANHSIFGRYHGATFHPICQSQI